MKAILPLLLLYLLPLLTLAQFSSYTYVFRITADEAETLYQKQQEDLYSAPYLYQVVDSFQRNMPVLPTGHYLLVSAKKEVLEIRQYSVHDYGLQQIKDGNHLSIAVMDSSGLAVNNAKLYFAGEEMEWQESAQLYRAKRPRENGWLRAEILGDTLFYQVEYNKVNPQRRRFFRTPIGYIISSPYRWTKNTYYFFKRGFEHKHWYLDWRRAWPFPKRNRQLRGYVALSQPTYRPGDTLRVKAYLTKRNGRPWKNPIQLEMYGNYKRKVLKRELSPDRPGAFATEIVLADSLQLDQFYNLSILVPGKEKYGTKIQHFKLEDYELDAAIFTLDLPDNEYRAGDPVVITASGNDQNGNPLPGATVELVALRQAVNDIAPDSLLIPDTLWTHQQDLSLREDSKIRLPDSIFPPARLNVKVEAFFATAGGESAQKNANFQYHYLAGKLDHSLRVGQWCFRYLERDSSITQTVSLESYRSIPPFVDTTIITLPFQMPIDPFVTAYTLRVDQKLSKYISVATEQSGIEVLGQHTHDSLLVDVANPHGLLISYQLYEGTKKIMEGEEEKTFFLSLPAKGKKKYQLFYQYTWAGGSQHQERSFQSYERQLNLATNIPNQIYPGQTVQVKIQATDSKSRPAKGVEMVAGATNAQFNSVAHLSPPRYTYKRRKGAKVHHKFSLKATACTHHSSISEDWYQEMGLDTMLYYQIRYPEQGVFEQRDTILKDSFYLDHPQISPYLVKNHQLQPIYLIYLNRELVYSHYSQDNTPYAFNARPGLNQLRIRTRDAEYRVDDIYLSAGHKLTIALDANTYGSHPYYGNRIKRIAAKKFLSEGEKQLLNHQMIRIRKEERQTVSYLYHDSTQIYRWNNTHSNSYNYPKVIGPVPGNSKLTYVQRDGLRNTFVYEPGFIYEIREGRERLYNDLFLDEKKQYEFPEKLPHPRVGELALAPKDIIAGSPKRKKINFRASWRYAPQGGDLQIYYGLPPDSTLVAISLQNVNGKYSILPGDQRYFAALPQGYYELTMITGAGYTSSKKCWIYPHQLQVLDLHGASFTQDNSLSVFDDLYSLELVKPSFLDQQSSGETQPANPYQEVGYLATGTAIDQTTGEPLIFANVLLVGTSIGTTTDFDGHWSLWVPSAGAILEISYMGYSSQQIKVSEIGDEIGLAVGEHLDEVVITAYRVPLIEQDNTTQGATLTSDQIRHLPTRNINALAATSAGIRVSDDALVNIRGSRSLATDYYVDGVRVSATAPGAGLLLNGSGIRSEFRDYGFWVTDLITDQEGEAYFTVTFPDDITQWKTFVLGMDDRKRAGAWYGQTAAFKPILAQLYLPRFLLRGDQIDLVGSSVNYTNDTFQINTQFEVEGEVLLQEKHLLEDGVTDQINYTAVDGRDSLTVKYMLQTANYQDGEERSIPIFKVGTEETIGSFHRLEGDTTIELNILSEDGPLTIYAEPDMLGLMLKEIDELINYPYGCNEQSASRLLALLMYKDIQEALGKPFNKEKAVQKMIALLRQRQLPDGSWGWWGGSARNQWMTIYVLRALHAAKEVGYATEAYEKGLLFLTNQLSQLEGRNRLEAIALFSEVGQNMDYESLLMPYDTLSGLNWTTLTTTLIKAQQGLSVQLDTLSKYRKVTLFDSHYWGEDAYGFYNNSIQYNLLTYRIYQAVGQTNALAPIRQFFLENRHNGAGYSKYGAYRNTFEAAMILKTILPDLLKDYKGQSELDFKQELQIIAGDTIHWKQLPQQLNITINDPLEIRKTGVGQTYLTAYQQRWNPEPKRVEGPFVVTTSLWQGQRQTSLLEQSRPARLKVELTVEKAASYILLEIPIPAGCSYGRKPQGSWSYHETYREYFREKVVIFCEQLEPGDYTYYVELEPRFSGNFQLNPAKAEQMYFPVFYGREGMKEVRITNNE